MHIDNSPRTAVGGAGTATSVAALRILHNPIKKNSKNPIMRLTREGEGCIIGVTDETGEKEKQGRKNLKKMKKSLDKRPEIWYTNKAVRKERSEKLLEN